MRTILIVDDNLINRKILKNILKNDYTILEACDGQAGLNILREKSEDISAIILDLVMPIMNGYEFLRRKNELKEYDSIPTIVTTIRSDEQTEIDVFECGAQDFVSKPYNLKIVKHKIDALIKIQESANYIEKIERDRLTNLFTRASFSENATRIMNEHPNVEYAVIVFNIENFRLVNDIAGTAKGDEILVRFANEIERYTKGRAKLIGRLYADKFIVLEEKKDFSILILKEFINFSLKNLSIAVELLPKAGVSFGNGNSSINLLCDRAILALDETEGKFDEHYGIYSTEKIEGIIREQELISAMQESLDKEYFEAYFQPKFNLKTMEMTGAEALARWNHPKLGFIMPFEFIPLFEKNGFIFNLDKFIWKKAAEMIRKQLDLGRVLPISVNLSRTDIYQDNIVEVFNNIIEKYNIPVELLHIEITETTYIASSKRLKGVIEDLKKNGFIIEMDDFGSGYSSINILSDLPIDILKIDMHLLRARDDNPNSVYILSGIIDIAKNLNVALLTEGVEIQSDVDYLLRIGCDYGQGYYYSRPISFNKFMFFVDNHNIQKTFIEQDIKFESKNNTINPKVYDDVPKGIILVDKTSYQIKWNNQLILNMLCNNNDIDLSKETKSIFDLICLESVKEFKKALKKLEKKHSNSETIAINMEYKKYGSIKTCVKIDLVDTSKDQTFALSIVDVYNSLINTKLFKEFNTILSKVNCAVYKTNYSDNNRFEYFSRGIKNLTGYNLSEFYEKTNGLFYNIIFEKDRERIVREGKKIIEGQIPFVCKYRIITKNGKNKEVVEISKSKRNENGQIEVFGILVDTNVLLSVKYSKMIFQSIYSFFLSQSQDLIFIWNPTDDELDVSAADKSNKDNELINVKHFEDIFDKDIIYDNDKEIFRKGFQECAKTGSVNIFEARIKIKGKYVWFKFSVFKISKIYGESHILSLVEDISVDKRYLEDMKIEANTDGLTGLSNRRYFIETINKSLRHFAKERVLIILDIDNFKHINDTNGHLIGDKTLKLFSKLMKEYQLPNSIISRIGGDEFAIFVRYFNSKKEIEKYVEKLMNIFKKLKNNFTFSAGIAYKDGFKISFEELYERADEALYTAKRNGKDQFYIYDNKGEKKYE